MSIINLPNKSSWDTGKEMDAQSQDAINWVVDVKNTESPTIVNEKVRDDQSNRPLTKEYLKDKIKIVETMSYKFGIESKAFMALSGIKTKVSNG